MKRFAWPILLLLALCAPALAANPQMGASGLPLPRFVSLKSDRVNVRQGPSGDHKVAWTYLRAGLPVEITAEFDNWRKIRDSEGAEGWVLQGLLSGRRTALVAPWGKGRLFDLLQHGRNGAAVKAKLESGVLVSVRGCNGNFCRVDAEKAEGFMKQDELWGVYPGEKVE
jgi:SH3-like domain-containing protein